MVVLNKIYTRTGDDGRAALGTWLYSVTRSVCFDHYRSKLAHSRNAEDPLDDLSESAQVSPLPGPERQLEARDEADQLWRALKALPAEFRVPLVLFEIEGLGYDEFASVEGVPIGTIRSRLSRARQQLRARLGTPETLPLASAGTGTGARSSNSGSARP